MRYTLGLFGIGLAIVAGTLGYFRQKPSTAYWIVVNADKHLYRMGIYGPGIQPIIDDEIEEFSVAPDGDSVAYVQEKNRVTSLRQVSMTGEDDRLLLDWSESKRLAWSSDGNYLCFIDYEGGNARLVLLDTISGEQSVMDESVVAGVAPIWGGQQVAMYSRGPRGSELLLRNIETNDTTPVAYLSTAPYISPVFSPDNKWIAFAGNYAVDVFGSGSASIPNSRNNLFAVHHDGRALRFVVMGLNVQHPILWVDGWIVFPVLDHEGKTVYKVRPDGSQLTTLADTSAKATITDISPDERWLLAYEVPGGRTGISASLLRIPIDGTVIKEIPTPFQRIRDAQWAVPADSPWHPVPLTIVAISLIGIGGIYRRIYDMFFRNLEKGILRGMR